MQSDSKVHFMHFFPCQKWLILLHFPLVSNIQQAVFWWSVCKGITDDVSVVSVCRCTYVCICAFKLRDHTHSRVTWIFYFASGCCGLPWYEEPCSSTWGWRLGRGAHSNGVPRDLTPLSWDTWAPYIPACSLCQNAHFLKYSFSNPLTPNSSTHPISQSRPTS